MARDQKPIADDELEAFEEAMDEQAVALREALATDLGGEPEEYTTRPVADGGE